MRNTREVIEDHLRLRREGKLEEDLRRNYAPDVAMLSATAVRHGHDGVRAQAAELARELGSDEYEYMHVQVAGDVGFLAWRGRSGEGERRAVDGADSYVVHDGRIVAQTVAYRVLVNGHSVEPANSGEGSQG